MSHVFISYSHSDKDRAYARKLADFLLENGFDVWIDDRIDFGSRWMHEIFKAIDECDAFIVVMSPRAYEREWIENERLHAKKREKIVFPLLLEGESFPDLGATQYYNVKDEKLPEKAFLERLAKFVSQRETTGQEVAAAPQQKAAKRAKHLIDFRDLAVKTVLAVAILFVGGGMLIYILQDIANRGSNLNVPTLVPTQFGGGQGHIAFASDRDGNFEIYIMNADGSNVRRLTTHIASDTYPVWSPDGSELAFRSDRDGDYEIYVMNADGSNPRRLTNNPASDWLPTWSPDGKQIAFMSSRDNNYGIYVMNADGSNPQLITNDPATDEFPAWSPNGEMIAFESNRDGNYEIYVMNADGSSPRRITNNPADDEAATWSPDGQKLAFMSLRDDNWEVYVIDVSGDNSSRLTNNSTWDGAPRWSPDGTQIVFWSGRDGDDEIYVMNTDGSNPRRLTNYPGVDKYPSWRP